MAFEHIHIYCFGHVDYLAWEEVDPKAILGQYFVTIFMFISFFAATNFASLKMETGNNN